MQGWQTTFLGLRELPRDISDFEMKAFFTFDGAEREAVNARRGDSHKLGLALHIGFLRMSGRLLGAFRIIPVVLWRHLGNELGIAVPEVASLRAMYECGRTLFDHQQLACTVLGFRWMSEHQRRSLVRELRDEVARHCLGLAQLLESYSVGDDLHRTIDKFLPACNSGHGKSLSGLDFILWLY